MARDDFLMPKIRILSKKVESLIHQKFYSLVNPLKERRLKLKKNPANCSFLKRKNQTRQRQVLKGAYNHQGGRVMVRK